MDRGKVLNILKKKFHMIAHVVKSTTKNIIQKLWMCYVCEKNSSNSDHKCILYQQMNEFAFNPFFQFDCIIMCTKIKWNISANKKNKRFEIH